MPGLGSLYLINLDPNCISDVRPPAGRCRRSELIRVLQEGVRGRSDDADAYLAVAGAPALRTLGRVAASSPRQLDWELLPLLPGMPLPAYGTYRDRRQP
jgi:hypothetical protein